ncbi:uncharacterized protein [Littorina saxatilis]|uniref:Uncharacterized protein n=1 Tax=Littorina saxatilis TaxID=31220 RepID=A0AAN9BEH5_9CAEN
MSRFGHKVFIVAFFIIYVGVSVETTGEECEVRKTAGNKTYTATEWCDEGCCENDDDRSLRCCDFATLSHAMIYGIVVTACMVLLSLCICIRMKAVAAAKPTTRRPTRPLQDSNREPEPEVNEAFEEDPPPPYWMCVAEDSPSDVITTPSIVTSSEPDDYDAAELVRARLYTITEEDLRLRSRSVRTTSSANPADLPDGVLLQPSSLSASMLASTSSTFPSVLPSASVTPDASFSQGAVFMFLPGGQMSTNVRPTILRSSDGSRVEDSSRSAKASSSSVTESPPLVSAAEVPISDGDSPETAAPTKSSSLTLMLLNNVSPPPASVNTPSPMTSSDNASVSTMPSTKPCSDSTSAATSSTATTSPAVTPSDKVSFVSGSAVTEILRQLSTTGMVVVFQKNDDGIAAEAEK